MIMFKVDIPNSLPHHNTHNCVELITDELFRVLGPIRFGKQGRHPDKDWFALVRAMALCAWQSNEWSWVHHASIFANVGDLHIANGGHGNEGQRITFGPARAPHGVDRHFYVTDVNDTRSFEELMAAWPSEEGQFLVWEEVPVESLKPGDEILSNSHRVVVNTIVLGREGIESIGVVSDAVTSGHDSWQIRSPRNAFQRVKVGR